MRQKPGLSLAIIAVLVAAWLALGFLIENSYYRLLLTIVPIWAVLAISWNVFSGYSGLVSFGHAAFFGLGAYTVTLCLVHWNITPWFGIPIGALLGAIAGVAIGYPTFRLRGSYFALAMLAYPLALVYLFEWMGYQEVTLPIKREAPTWFMQYSDQRVYLLLALGLLTVALVISLAIERSRFGMSLLAVKQNELAAEAAGVDTLRWKLRAIVLSAALASAAGGLYAVVLLVVTPTSVFGLVVSAQAMILALFGGAGILWGPVIGAAVLVPMSEVLQAELGHLLPGIQGIVYGIAIILVILLAPEGIYWRVRDLLARGAKPSSIVPSGGAPESISSSPTPVARVQPIHPARILEVRGISKSYGGLKAVHDVSFAVPEGSIVGIIGPNGAGKTTLFNLLNGLVRPDAGSMTARADVVASALTNKELRLMELARALASEPKLVLMDEPLAGLGATETREVIGLIRALPSSGVTVAIIEHTMHAMVTTVDNFVVLDHGQLLTEGPPAEVTRNPQVIEAYLGRKWAMKNVAS